LSTLFVSVAKLRKMVWDALRKSKDNLRTLERMAF